MAFEMPKPKKRTVFIPPGLAAKRVAAADTQWENFDEHGDLYRLDRWRKLRMAALTSQPICELCRRAAGEEAHHIWRDRELFFARENLATLCHDCHEKITAAYRRKVDKSILFGERGTDHWHNRMMEANRC